MKKNEKTFKKKSQKITQNLKIPQKISKYLKTSQICWKKRKKQEKNKIKLTQPYNLQQLC